jgi:hypothetical protein
MNELLVSDYGSTATGFFGNILSDVGRGVAWVTDTDSFDNVVLEGSASLAFKQVYQLQHFMNLKIIQDAISTITIGTIRGDDTGTLHVLPYQYLAVTSFPYSSSDSNYSLSVSIIVYNNSSACLHTPLIIESRVHLIDNGTLCCADVEQIYEMAGGGFQQNGVVGM